MNQLAAELGIDPVELRLRNAGRRTAIEGITGRPCSPKGSACAGRDPRPALHPLRVRRADLGDPEPFSTHRLTPVRSPSARPAWPRLRDRATRTSASRSASRSDARPRSGSTPTATGLTTSDPTQRRAVPRRVPRSGRAPTTAMRQMAAEATAAYRSIAVTGHVLRHGDLGRSPDRPRRARLTFMAGNSILGAAEEAREGDGATGSGRPVGLLPLHPATRPRPLDPDTGVGVPNFSLRLHGAVSSSCHGRHRDRPHPCRPGHVDPRRRSGDQPPRSCSGQIEGAVVQAHGYALSEDLQLRRWLHHQPAASRAT